MKKSLFAAALAAGLSLGLASAQAEDCTMPGAPAIPDGATATEADFKDAVTEIKAFQAGLGDYRQCLDDQKLPTKGGDLSEEQIQVNKVHNQALDLKYNESVDVETDLVNRYSAQAGIFKAR